MRRQSTRVSDPTSNGGRTGFTHRLPRLDGRGIPPAVGPVKRPVRPTRVPGGSLCTHDVGTPEQAYGYSTDFA